MKTIHRLTTFGLCSAIVISVTLVEILAWQICHALGWRFAGVAIGAVTTGLVVAFIAWRYDGDGNE